MPNGKLHLPPEPTTPKEAPWREIEAIIDGLNNVASKLDALLKVLPTPAAIPPFNGRIDTIVSKLNELVRIIEIRPTPAIPPEVTPLITRQASFQYTLPMLTGVRLVEGSPLTGVITQVIIHWPPGTEALVDIAFGHNGKWVLPHIPNTYLAFDSATPVFTVYEPILESEELWVVFMNGDEDNKHTVSLAVTIEGVE